MLVVEIRRIRRRSLSGCRHCTTSERRDCLTFLEVGKDLTFLCLLLSFDQILVFRFLPWSNLWWEKIIWNYVFTLYLFLHKRMTNNTFSLKIKKKNLICHLLLKKKMMWHHLLFDPYYFSLKFYAQTLRNLKSLKYRGIWTSGLKLSH